MRARNYSLRSTFYADAQILDGLSAILPLSDYGRVACHSDPNREDLHRGGRLECQRWGPLATISCFRRAPRFEFQTGQSAAALAGACELSQGEQLSEFFRGGRAFPTQCPAPVIWDRQKSVNVGRCLFGTRDPRSSPRIDRGCLNRNKGGPAEISVLRSNITRSSQRHDPVDIKTTATAADIRLLNFALPAVSASVFFRLRFSGSFRAEGGLRGRKKAVSGASAPGDRKSLGCRSGAR